MKSIVYLLGAAVGMILTLWIFIFLSTILEIFTLGNKVQDSLVAAGWAGFYHIDLDRLAKRRDIDDEEERDVYLFEDDAKEEVMNYIQKNLKLNAFLYPTPESYIVHNSHPVIIDELEVYNPDDLPASCSRGVTFNRTTIHIVLRIPVDVKLIGFHYFEKHVDVDTKSFYKD